MVTDDPLITDPDRGRGIFARVDREYLQDPDNYKTRQSRWKRREAIPDRIRNAMFDFAILAHPEFPGDLIDDAFSVREDEVDEYEGPWVSLVERGEIDQLSNPEVEDAAIDAIAFFHRVYPPVLFNNIIEEGVKRAVEYYYPEHEVRDASYDPEITRQGAAHDRAKRFLEEGVPLSDEQVRLLLQEGDVDPEEVAEQVRSQRRQADQSDSQTIGEFDG